MNGKDVRTITEAILNDYDHQRAIDRLEYFDLVDKVEVEMLIEKLLSILYPAYYRARVYKVYDVKASLVTIIEDALYHLTKIISSLLPYLDKYKDKSEQEIREDSQQLTLAFFNQIPYIRHLLDTDLEALYDGDPAATNKDEIILAYPGFYAITIYRVAHELYQLEIPLLSRMLSEHAHSKTGIDIHPGAKISPYFFIDHGTGIVIGETTEIGEHVKIYQGVTLGALSTRGGQLLKGKKRHPTIEDHVTIYSGASILGGDTVIGRGSVIGGNVFLTSSIKANTKVSIKSQELHMKND